MYQLKEIFMKDFKIRVNNKSESREAQELLFELGHKWVVYNTEPHFLHKSYLFANSGKITTSEYEYEFNTSSFKEVTLQQLKDTVILHRNSIDDLKSQLKAVSDILIDDSYFNVKKAIQFY